MEDVDVLESVQAAVGPLADFTDIQLVTVSSIKPVLHVLKRNILAEASSNTHLTADIKSRILQYIGGKYSDGDIGELLNVASFLDPCFMSNYIIGDTKLAVPTQPNDSADSAPPSHKQKKLGAWLKLAN